MNTETIKATIKKSYGEIAKGTVQVGCCSPETGCCGTDAFTNSMSEGYENVTGYQPDADLSLGCGLPTELANIQPGDTVIDLGSGAGNDAFIARSIVGEKGRVIGIDMTPEMVVRAWQNAHKLGFDNVEFELGEIEEMSMIADETADVVVSNCVMNLIPNKAKAFREVIRVLKTGGHFSISDIVSKGAIPAGILKAAEMYAGCVAGAVELSAYLGIIKSAGFKNIQIKKERLINLSDELLLKFISLDELEAYKSSGAGIYSITVYADKLNEGSCCAGSGTTCCTVEPVNSEKPVATSCCGGTSNNGCCS